MFRSIGRGRRSYKPLKEDSQKLIDGDEDVKYKSTITSTSNTLKLFAASKRIEIKFENETFEIAIYKGGVLQERTTIHWSRINDVSLVRDKKDTLIIITLTIGQTIELDGLTEDESLALYQFVNKFLYIPNLSEITPSPPEEVVEEESSPKVKSKKPKAKKNKAKKEVKEQSLYPSLQTLKKGKEVVGNVEYMKRKEKELEEKLREAEEKISLQRIERERIERERAERERERSISYPSVPKDSLVFYPQPPSFSPGFILPEERRMESLLDL